MYEAQLTPSHLHNSSFVFIYARHAKIPNDKILPTENVKKKKLGL